MAVLLSLLCPLVVAVAGVVEHQLNFPHPGFVSFCNALVLILKPSDTFNLFICLSFSVAGLAPCLISFKISITEVFKAVVLVVDDPGVLVSAVSWFDSSGSPEMAFCGSRG